MPNKKAKYRKQERRKKNAAIKKYKRNRKLIRKARNSVKK